MYVWRCENKMKKRMFRLRTKAEVIFVVCLMIINNRDAVFIGGFVLILAVVFKLL